MTHNRQLTMFDVPSEKTATFSVYHDESGTDPDHSRFQMHGVLFVPESKSRDVFSALHAARRGYEGQVHFVKLRDKTSSQKAQVSREWLQLFFCAFSYDCFYKCMIADTAASSFNASRFPKAHHLYNYTAMLAVFGGIVWSLKTYDRVSINLFSERKSRSSDDNFATYLPFQIAKRVKAKRSRRDGGCPEIAEPIPPVILVCGNPEDVELGMEAHCEIIQLTDLITGAVAQAVNASASQRVKFDLGVMVAGWIEDTRLPPWLQDKDLHRRFSVSCYPDCQGGFFDIPLAITCRDQLSLFDE